MPDGPGEALDFGHGGGGLGLVAAQRGFEVTGLDRVSYDVPFVHPHLKYLQGDILEVDLGLERFDLVINCSVIEHVGLVGRYETSQGKPDGDFEAMSRLRAIMKPDGRMLMTIPMGRDAVFSPMCRVYGSKRLPLLLSGFAVDQEQYWVKDDANRWTPRERHAAESFEASAGDQSPLRNRYALGCFVLRKVAST
jgi:SAM-dependent methyltransferase